MAVAPKKLLILAILEILRKYTDADHRLLQTEILNKLESDYDLTATRKTVHANLMDLSDAGYPIVEDGGWYYEHEFCEAELNLLADSVLYNPNVPYHQGKQLIEKLKVLGGEYYHVNAGMKDTRVSNRQFLFTLEILHEAMNAGKKVSFKYGDYDVDKKLHARKNEDGKDKEYPVNPYRIVSANGRYYLICNVDKYDTLTHFRVDYILDARVEEAAIKPIERIPEFKNGVDTARYIAEHPHMFTGEVITANVIVKRSLVSELLDRFGTETIFTKVTDDEVEATVRMDELSLKYWLQMYAEFARRV